MLKLASGNLKRRKIPTQSQTISPDFVINFKGKTSSFTVEKPSRRYLNQLTKVNISGFMTYCHHVSLTQYNENNKTFL